MSTRAELAAALRGLPLFIFGLGGVVAGVYVAAAVAGGAM